MTDDTETGIAIDGSRRRFLATAGAVGAGLLAGCTGNNGGPVGSSDGGSSGGGESGAWRSIELSTVRGGEAFTVDSLEPPVVIQSFAVWCPKCERQSNHLSGVTDSLTVVSLNTDPNEDTGAVREHANDNGFDWRFAVSPTEMTQSLVADFGNSVTNAPSTPIVVACEDNAEFTSGSITSASEIRSIASDC